MKFSLVLATVDRTDEPARFLESLSEQTHRDLEVILVDQNPDRRLHPLLDAWRGRMPVVHVRAPRGLSRARNAGLRLVTGEAVAFPDDDCRYPPDLLERVARVLQSRPSWDGVTGRVVDERGRVATGRFDPGEGWLDGGNVWRRGMSAAVFLRRRVIARVGDFDESLGLGSGGPFESGEETDYLLRAIACGFRLRYLPELAVLHPAQEVYGPQQAARGYRYGCGMGRVLRKHGARPWTVAWMAARSLGGALLCLGRGRPDKARYHWRVGQGRLRGWRGSA